MKVSVIVPIYNVENYVEHCINSLINQDFEEEYEILTINDGSTDNSLNMIIEKFKDESKVKIISQSNKGLSSARNTGIKNSIGDYLLFVDSDDFVDQDYIRTLYNRIKKNDLDVLFSSYKYFYDKKKVVIRQGIELSEKIYSGKEIAEYLYKKKTFRAEVWDDIYKADFIKNNNIFFTEGIINEDEEFTLKVLINAKKAQSIKYNGYYYRQRENSITKSINYKKSLESQLILINNFIDIFNREKVSSLKIFIYWRIFDITNNLLKSMLFSKNLDINIDNIYKFLYDNSNNRIRKVKLYFIKKDKVNYIKYNLLKDKIKTNVKRVIS